MVQYCVMVKGPCRGRMCDFWARIKIRKSSMNKLVDDLLKSIATCSEDGVMGIEQAFHEYWNQLGVRDRAILCKEEPELCMKMQFAEEQAAARLVAPKH